MNIMNVEIRLARLYREYRLDFAKPAGKVYKLCLAEVKVLYLFYRRIFHCLILHYSSKVLK